MTAIRVAVALGLTLARCAVGADASVRAWEGSIKLLTWEEGFADATPHFPVLGAERAWYPYAVRASLGKQNRQETWRTLNLENDYLTCVVLPDLGGHLYSCRDKLSGYEMFHANPSVKKAMMGLRGAWSALGVELNFPVGHSLVTVSPVDFRTSQTEDAASVWVGATDRVSGMRWRVEFTLRRGAALLQQTVRLENSTSVRHRYYWWTNASVTLGDDTRFVLPTKYIAGHGRAQVDTWPVGASGLDRSVPRNFPSSVGWFAEETREPFLAVYHPASQTGTLHYADASEVPGKKIWVWGRDEDREVRGMLSDNNSQYVEIQAGLFANQETYGFLEPWSSRSFTEYWIPVRKMEGITHASRDGVLNLARNEGAVRAQLLATRAIAGAKVRISCGAKTLVEEAVALDPAQTWTRNMPSAPAEACRFQLLDNAGKALLEYTEGQINASESVKPGTQPSAAPVRPTVDSAAYFELQGDYQKAREDFDKAAAQALANVAVRKGAGRLAATLQQFEHAATLLANATDAEAHYYRGVALAGLGKDDDARREWSAARTDAPFSLAAGIETAAAFARSGDVPKARKELTGAAAQGVRSLVMEAALARAEGDATAAKSTISRAAALDATDYTVRFEQVRQGASDVLLWEHLAADPQRVLEVADLYLHWGRYKDALEVLMFPYSPLPAMRREPGAVTPQDNALVAYYRGYCHGKLNDHMAEDYRLGSVLPVRYVFPNRPAERRILEAVLQVNPSDANAHYLLGLWYLNAQLVPEGSRELQAAQRLRPDMAEARSLLSALKLPMSAIPAEPPPAAPVFRPPPKKVEAPKVEPPKAPAPTPAPAIAPAPTPAAPSSPLAAVPGWLKPSDNLAAALDAAAAGNLDQAFGYFNKGNFPEGKQPDSVRQAYIELHLQRLLALARARQCVQADSGITTLGYEDKSLPFTFGGFGAFTKGARFQYLLGVVEAACVDEKDARKRFEKVSRMRSGPASPDFAYSYMAQATLAPGVDLKTAVQQVESALANAGRADLPVLLYNKGMLLLVSGNKEGAAAAFRQGADRAPAGMLKYLNQDALRTMSR